MGGDETKIKDCYIKNKKKTDNKPPKHLPCDHPIARSAAVPGDDIIDGDSQLGDGM